MAETESKRLTAYLGLVDGQELPEGYQHYTWISNNCLEGIAWSEENGLDYDVVPLNDIGGKEIVDYLSYLDGVSNIVMEYARGILNKYHHTEYTLEQWRVILYGWMERYLEENYMKYLRFTYIERMNKNFECALYGTDDYFPVLDYSDYGLLLGTDAFHLYQYSQLYQAMKPLSNISVRQYLEYSRPPMMKTPTVKKRSLRYHAYHTILKTLEAFGRTRVVLYASYLPERFLLKMMLKHPGTIVNYNELCDYFGEVRNGIPVSSDMAWRNLEEPLPEGHDQFTMLMCALLKKSIPVAYVEGFPYLRKRAQTIFRHAMHPKAIIFSSGAVSTRDIFSIYVAEIMPTDALICGMQHGGSQGDISDIFYIDPYRPCDIVYTWGWDRAGKEKNYPCTFKPMPPNKLCGVPKPFQKESEDILYVSYNLTKNSWETHISYAELQAEKDFITAFERKHGDVLRYRTFFPDGAYKDIKKSAPDLRLDTIPNFYESLASSKLMVSSCFDTPALEAIWLNKPFLAVRTERVTTAPEAADDIEALRRVGILSYSFAELSERIEEILPDVDGWWNEPERQAAINRFREKYVNMPDNAEKVWERELMRLAEL